MEFLLKAAWTLIGIGIGFGLLQVAVIIAKARRGRA